MILGATIKLRDQFTTTMKKARKSTEDMSKSMKLAGLQANRMKKDFEYAYKAAQPRNMFDSAKRAGAAMTTAGVAVAAGLGIAVKKGMEFDAAMSQVAAISGATGQEFEDMKKAARNAGAITSKTAKESADALMYMSLAGWDSKTSMDALLPVLRLSEAGAMELGRTSDLVTDSMATLGLQSKDLSMYLDQVAQTSRKSNTNIDMLMEAMLTAGGTFESLTVPIHEANAMLGILANRGVKGAQAGTAVNAVMVNLTTRFGKAGKALDALNINAFDNQGKFKGMANVLREVNDKTKGMTEEQRNMYLAMIGGKEHLKNLQKMLAGVDDEYDQLVNDIKNSEGVLDLMSKQMLDNLQGDITILKSGLDEMAIGISDSLEGSVRKVMKHFQGLVDKFNTLDGNKKKIIATTLAVSAGLLLLGGPLLLLVGMLPSIAAGFAIVKTAMSALLLVGINPITLGILAAVAVGVLLYKNWDKIKKKAKELKDKILDLKGGILYLKDNAVQNLKDAIDKVKDKFNEWEGIIKGTATVLTVIFGPALIRTGVQATITGAKVLGGLGMSFLRTAVMVLWLNGVMVADLIRTFIKTGVEAVKTAAIMTGQFVVSMAKTGLEAIKTAAIITGQLIVSMAKYALSGWRAVGSITALIVAWGIQKGAMLASAAVTGIMTAAQWALNAALWANPLTWVVLGILALVAAGILLYKNWDTVKEKAIATWGFIKTTIGGFIDNIVIKFNEFKAKILKIWDDIKTFLKNPIKGAVNLVENVVKNNGKKPKGHAAGLSYVPYDNYPALLHKGEAVLPRRDADHYRTGDGGVTIAKLADTIVVREDADIDKIANALAAKLRQSASNRGRVVTA